MKENRTSSTEINVELNEGMKMSKGKEWMLEVKNANSKND